MKSEGKHRARKSADTGRGLSSHEVNEVLRAYNVGKLQFTRPGAGTASPAVIVVTNRGTFFLKRRNPRYCSRGQLNYDHSVIRHLAKSGLPVVTPVRTLDGSRWLEREESIYELYPFIEGKAAQLGNLDQVRAAGGLLGRFHRATEDFVPKGEKPQVRMHDPRATLAGLREAGQELQHRQRKAEDPPERLDGWASQLAELEDTAHGILQRLPDAAYWGLPQCVIHGDYHPANLKYQANEIVGLFDFDWVGKQPRMVDVADGLIFGCGVRKAPMDAGDIRALTQTFRFDRALLGAFGQGYGAEVEPTAEELRALPDLLRARWLFCRVDAMQRKVAQRERLSYLLEDVGEPLAQITQLEEGLQAGEWLRG